MKLVAWRDSSVASRQIIEPPFPGQIDRVLGSPVGNYSRERMRDSPVAKLKIVALLAIAVLMLASMPSVPAAGANPDADLATWDETATWTRFNSTLNLTWANEGGDWLDANGQAQGSVPFSSIDLVDDDQPGLIDIDVSSQVFSTQAADFHLRRRGGVGFVFASREAASGGPILTINGTTAIEPAADTSLHSSTVRALGEGDTLETHGSILIRFDLPEDIPITSATLTLESTGLEYGDQTLEVYQTNPTLRTVTRPSWLSVDPTEVATFNGTDVPADGLTITVQDDIATAQLSAPDLTWISAVQVIPNMTEGCATVYQQFGTDFRPGDGGKLPGFANTGSSISGDDVVDGVSYPDSAWGGRPPDGIHWSARTGYGQWTDSHVGANTYFYALDPNNLFGWGDPLGSPFPKGEWIAYVQCMQLNTVTGSLGNSDGKLYYEIAGVGPVYSREDIRWRDSTAPESEMREFWVNYYCGGTSCGDIENRGTVSFSKVVITRGLPDMDAVLAEVDRLNEGSPPVTSDVAGDVSCDGIVAIRDAIMVAQYIVGLRTAAQACPIDQAGELFLPAADVDTNGTITIRDAVAIAQCTVDLDNGYC